MKVRDSGMPEELYWGSLFDIPVILDRMGLNPSLRDVVEFGCGYRGSHRSPALAVRFQTSEALEIAMQLMSLRSSLDL